MKWVWKPLPQSVSIAVQANSLHFTLFSSRGEQCGDTGPENPPLSSASLNPRPPPHWFQSPNQTESS